MSTINSNTAKLANKCTGTTGSKLIECRFEWKIMNFSFFPNPTNSTVSAKSPIFSMGSRGEYKWQLEFNACHSSYGSNNISVYVSNLSSGNTTISGAKLKLFVSDVDKNLVECYTTSNIDRFQGNPPGFRITSTNMSFLKLLENSSKLLPNDCLTLVCDIVSAEHTSSVIIDQVDLNEISEHQSSDGFGALYESSRLSDVRLVAKCGREFRAHKAILAAQSPVFLAMFENHMKERRKNRVELIEFDANVLDEMLRFIYTGKTTELADTIADSLLAAADMYQLEGLKLLCLKKLETGFATDNAFKLLVIADLYRSDRLKTLALNFISEHIEELVQTESFNSMRVTHQHLMHEIVLALAGGKI